MKSLLAFVGGMVVTITIFAALPHPNFTRNATGWTVQYQMPVCPDDHLRYTSIPDRDESDTFTLYCQKPQFKIRAGGTDANPTFRDETADDAVERVREQ